MNNKNKMGLIIALAGCVAGNVVASNLTSYANGDVLICFRNASSGYNLVVDAGPVSTFVGYAHNSRNTVLAYSTTQLNDIGGANGVSWSAFTWTNGNTIYVTQARPAGSIGVQTTPLPDQSSTFFSLAGGRMLTIPTGATNFYNGVINTAPPYSDSTAAAIIEDYYSYNTVFNQANPSYLTGASYYNALVGGQGGNFNGYLTHNPENTTPAGFSTSGQVARSDFYMLTPTSGYGQGTGVYLGYFELNTNGVMTYVAYPTAVPIINTMSNATNTMTISYTTGTYGTYTLQATNSAGLASPKSTWPVVSTLSTGDTGVHTVTDTTTDPNKFYIITGN
jgi:hypothetical protein